MRTKICISIAAETTEELLAKITEAEKFDGLIEVRFDALVRGQVESAITAVSGSAAAKRVIATFRSDEQGGRGGYTFDERREFWSKAGGFGYVDVEEDIAKFAPDGPIRIVSHHDLNGVPPDIDAIAERLAAAADIVKIAAAADDACDALPLIRILKKLTSQGKQMISLAMGDAGKWTRILGPSHGGYLTFAPLAAGDETASGQITADDLRDVFGVDEITGETKTFGVIGDPIARSRSPYMHNPAFRDAGIDAVFISFLVKDIEAFIRRMVKPDTREIDLNFGGFSVTMPHKRSVMPYLDEIDENAKAVGAVNTIAICDGKLTGSNTDVYGFITPLVAKLGDLTGMSAAVFGAGGASRAVVYALKKQRAVPTVFARDTEKAKGFAKDLDVEIQPISDTLTRHFDIIVNTTPLGMAGENAGRTILRSAEMRNAQLVYDIVTSAKDTPLITEAKTAGVPTIGGIDMLIAQGMRQFEIWTGRQAPGELMRDALSIRMQASSVK